MRWGLFSIRGAALIGIAIAVLAPTVTLCRLDEPPTRSAPERLIVQHRHAVPVMPAAALVQPLWTLDDARTRATASRGLRAVRARHRRGGRGRRVGARVAGATLADPGETTRRPRIRPASTAAPLQKLRSLPKVDVHPHAQTTEVTGDGQKVRGLVYAHRASGEEHRVEPASVFVQIGLVPDIDWSRGTVELSNYREIIVDAKCATSLPGGFAAGDATTAPFKQIVIAALEGSMAALPGFDHPMRTPAA